MKTWTDEFFIKLCYEIASQSKDDTTKLGAIIVGKHNVIVSTGCNSFPRGAKDDIPARQQRPEKYLYMAHAEANAVYNAALLGHSTDGCRIYVPWTPCSNYAIAIIQSGINKVICEVSEMPYRWSDSIKASRELC